MDAIVAEVVDDGAAGLSYYHEIDAQLYSVTSDTFIGQIYDLFGLVNIADEAEDPAGGYPQLSAEFIVEQDPDLIFVSYPGGVDDVRASRVRHGDRGAAEERGRMPTSLPVGAGRRLRRGSG